MKIREILSGLVLREDEMDDDAAQSAAQLSHDIGADDDNDHSSPLGGLAAANMAMRVPAVRSAVSGAIGSLTRAVPAGAAFL